MPEERLELIIEARDEGSQAVDQARQRIDQANVKSFEDLQRFAREHRQSLELIEQGTNEVAAAFRRGEIDLESYLQKMRELGQQTEVLAQQEQLVVLSDQLSGNIARVGRSATGSVAGIGSLRSAMGSLAFASAGLPGRLGEVSSIVSSFAIGSLTTAGVFAGLAALGLAFRTVADRAKEAADEAERAFEKTIGALSPAAQEAERTRRRIGEVQGEIAAERAFGERFGPEEQLLRAGTIDRLTAELAELNATLARQEEEALSDFVSPFRQRRAEREADAMLKRLAGDAAFEAAVANMLGIRQLADGRLVPFRDVPTFEGLSFARVSLGDAGAPTTKDALGRPIDRGGVGGLGITGPLLASPIILQRINNNLEKTADDTQIAGRALVTSLAGAAAGLARIAQGDTLGGLGGLLTGLSFIPGLGTSVALGLGLGGVGLSFIDALTDDRTRDTQKNAHLDALREFEQERPPANIIVRLDPGDRGLQQLINDARREAQDAGFRPDVTFGTG